MKGNLQGVGQEELEVEEEQLPQYPVRWLARVSVAVLHQGRENPPAVVQEVYVTPW